MKTNFNETVNSCFTIIVAILLFACSNNDNVSDIEIAGTYTGTLIELESGRSINSNTILPATAIIRHVADQIEVRCTSENFDTSIMLDIYDNGNQVMVCLTGADFQNMYGHALGDGNMMHDGNEWMQHLNNEHEEHDEHFGSFDLQHNSFNFTFHLSHGDFHFQGIKN